MDDGMYQVLAFGKAISHFSCDFAVFRLCIFVFSWNLFNTNLIENKFNFSSFPCSPSRKSFPKKQMYFKWLNLSLLLYCLITALISDLCRNEVEWKKITLICILIKKKFFLNVLIFVEFKIFHWSKNSNINLEMENTIKQIIFAIFSIFSVERKFFTFAFRIKTN